MADASSSNFDALQDMAAEMMEPEMMDLMEIGGSEAADYSMSDVAGSDLAMDTATLACQDVFEDLGMESQESFDTSLQPQSKGKSKLVEVEEREDKPFPLMELPTEIRLEIYRACLTRPYKIMLSKAEKPARSDEPAVLGDGQAESEAELEMEMDEERQAAITRYQQARAARGLPAVDYPRARARAVSMTNRSRNNTTPRAARPIRLPTIRSSTASDASTSAPLVDSWAVAASSVVKRASQPKSEDPLIINILRTSKEVYKEARDIFYSENIFDIDIRTAVSSLAALHQRSRRHIKHVEIEVPNYTEILEGFSEVVRLSLRYCSGLKTFTIHTPWTLPGTDGHTSSSNTTVYANGFDILRWLPQPCEVILEGSDNPEIQVVVNKHLQLAKTQDKVRFASPRYPLGV